MYWQVACFGGFRLGSPLSGFARVNFAGKRGQVLSDWLAFGIADVAFGIAFLVKTAVSGERGIEPKRNVGRSALRKNFLSPRPWQRFTVQVQRVLIFAKA